MQMRRIAAKRRRALHAIHFASRALAQHAKSPRHENKRRFYTPMQPTLQTLPYRVLYDQNVYVGQKEDRNDKEMVLATFAIMLIFCDP